MEFKLLQTDFFVVKTPLNILIRTLVVKPLKKKHVLEDPVFQKSDDSAWMYSRETGGAQQCGSPHPRYTFIPHQVE